MVQIEAIAHVIHLIDQIEEIVRAIMPSVTQVMPVAHVKILAVVVLVGVQWEAVAIAVVVDVAVAAVVDVGKGGKNDIFKYK